jgi:hypothetical protein
VNTPKITKKIFLAFLYVFCKDYGDTGDKLITDRHEAGHLGDYMLKCLA